MSGWANLTLLAALAGLPVVAAPSLADLRIQFLDVKNSEGGIAVALYEEQNAKAYPTDADRALRRAYVELVKSKNPEVLFTGLAPGRYAVSAYHDEDGDKELDSNFIGIPSEGVGASNDAKGSFGPPKFKDAALDLKSGMNQIQVRLKY